MREKSDIFLRGVAIFFLVGMFYPNSVLSQKPTKSEVGIAKQEKNEVREFTKDFIERLKQTRDVRPLSKNYFVKDFQTFNYYYLLDSDTHLNDLPASQWKRWTLAFLNFAVVLAPYTVPGLDFEKEFPPSLRRKYSRFSIDGGDSPFTKPGFLPSIEAFYRGVAAYQRRHPFEVTKRYRDAVKKRESLEDYNYSITEDVPESDADNRAAKWLRSNVHSKTYLVGTPVGLGVGIIRIGNKYKVLYLTSWPISYDPRLGK